MVSLSKCAGGFPIKGMEPCARCGSLSNQVCKEHYAQLDQQNNKMRTALEFIAAQENLTFAECSLAEEIVSRAKSALV